jgi:uncharacterized protein
MVAQLTEVDLTPAFGAGANGFLKRAVAALTSKLPVAEVWLFGSAARGEAGPQSDIDLLVVMEDGNALKHPTAACFQVVLGLHEKFPVDVVATVASRWRAEREGNFGVLGEAAKEGILLYAK